MLCLHTVSQLCCSSSEAEGIATRRVTIIRQRDMSKHLHSVQVIAAFVTSAKCLSLGSSAVAKVPIVDFAEFYGRYDAFLLDQFGVVHVSKIRV